MVADELTNQSAGRAGGLRISLMMLGFLFVVAVVCQAQGTGLVAAHGTLLAPPGAALDQYTVVVTGPDRREHRAKVDPMGGFFLSQLPQGDCELRVLGGSGAVIHRETVGLWDAQSRLEIRLPGWSKAEPPAGGTIAISRLMHKPTKAATKEFGKGESAARRGDFEAAFQHYMRAVTLDDDWYEALVNLGAQCYKTDRMAEAVTYLRRAIAVDPTAAEAHVNLSAALAALQEYRESEQAARRALELEPGYTKARYVLGFALAAQGETQCAVDELRQATDIAAARQLLQLITVGR